MATFASIVAIIHFCVFLFSLYLYRVASVQSGYVRKDHIYFIKCIITFVGISIICTNALAILTSQDHMTAVGFSATPLFPFLLVLSSYVVVNLVKKLKYLPVFFACVLSWPLTLLFNLMFSNYIVSNFL